MKRMQIYHTFAVAAALILMALPFGVKGYYAMTANPALINVAQPVTMSFFDMSVFEFNIPLPFMTGVITLALTVLSIIRSILNVRALSLACMIVSAAAFVVSIMPLLLYGLDYYTTVSMSVSFVLLCAMVLDICTMLRIPVVDEE